MKYHKGVASVILDLLHDGQVRKTSEIQQGVPASRSAFNQSLQKLLITEQIVKVGYGKYRIGDPPPDVDTEARKDDNGQDTARSVDKPPSKDEQTEPVVVTRTEPVDKGSDKPPSKDDKPRKDGTPERAVGKVTRKDDNDPYRFVFYPAIKIS